MRVEAVYEDGIGERRGLVLENGAVAEMHIEREGVRAGDVWDARLTARAGQRGTVDLGGVEALLEPVPERVAEGALLRVEVRREAVPERGRPRQPRVGLAGEAGAAPGLVRAGPRLGERLRARGVTVVDNMAAGEDRLEAAGWSEAIEEAATGLVRFEGGWLTLSPTPAMTAVDVDGPGAPGELARAAARALGQAVRRHGLGGSIVVDFPTLGDRELRLETAAEVDRHMPPPFERTAINGFGLMQIVRPRVRASTLELVQGDPVATAALGLLRRAERVAGAGALVLAAAPAVERWLIARGALLAELQRRVGAPVRLRCEPMLAISAGHVTRDSPVPDLRRSGGGGA